VGFSFTFFPQRLGFFFRRVFPKFELKKGPEERDWRFCLRCDPPFLLSRKLFFSPEEGVKGGASRAPEKVHLSSFRVPRGMKEGKLGIWFGVARSFSFGPPPSLSVFFKNNLLGAQSWTYTFPNRSLLGFPLGAVF